jgi:expansin (peptidoglycan-binding protein)
MSGDGTYFKIGLGSCGGTNYAGQDLSQPVVALAAAYYDDAKTSPCGKTIHITAENGKTATGIVSDKCPECTIGSIDLSEMLFVQLFGDTGVGRGKLSWTIEE